MEDGEPPPGRGVYCNRTLNLRSIAAIGYDMDYTLVHYRVEDWERRAYQHLLVRLAALGLPVDGLEFDPELTVRGLVVDTDLGNLLKANRFGYVKAAFHGTQRLTFEALRSTYGHMAVELSAARFRFLNTLFSLSEACIFAQLVDLCDQGALPDGLGYHELYAVVRDNIDATHTEGQLKAEIMADPERYVERDEETVLTLLDQLHAGKRLLIITNSEWRYTRSMMEHCFDPFLPKSTRWRQLFEATIVEARKPSFFESDAPLLRIVDDHGRLEPDVRKLEPHGCYFGGHAALLEKHLGVSGDEILYLGDHMFGDVHVSKRMLRWRTGLILRELEAEFRAVEESQADQAQLAVLMAEKEAVERRLSRAKLGILRKKAGYGSNTSLEVLTRNRGELRSQINELDERIAPLAARAATRLNKNWGLLMRAGNDKSQLARQVERYADVYTSRVSNFVYATPFAYLRAPGGSLPHDPLPHPLIEER